MSYIDYVNESVRSPEQELDDLKKANGFTAVELALNRLGKIGAGQTSQLIEQLLRPLVKSFLVMAGWLLLILVTTWIISAGIHLDAHRPFTGMAFFRRFWLFRGLYVLTFVRLGAVIMVISCRGVYRRSDDDHGEHDGRDPRHVGREGGDDRGARLHQRRREAGFAMGCSA